MLNKPEKLVHVLLSIFFSTLFIQSLVLASVFNSDMGFFSNRNATNFITPKRYTFLPLKVPPLKYEI